MTLFNRLFRKPPPPYAAAPPTVEERITKIADGSSDDALRTALSADVEAVRAAAIARLPDGDVLRSLAGLTAAVAGVAEISDALRRTARSRIAQLIDTGVIDFNGLRDTSSDPFAVFAVAALCKDPKLLEQAFSLLEDSAQVDALIVDGPSSRVRQLAAETVEDPARIRALLKQIRGKDKVVYKILKQKVDAVNEAERIAAQNSAETAAACAALERHAQRDYDVHFASTLEHLRSRWRSIAAKPEPDMEARVERAIERCEHTIAEQRRLEQVNAAEQAARRAAEQARECAARAAREAAETEAAAEAQRRAEADAVRATEAAALVERLAAQEHFYRQIGGLIRKAHEALGDGTTQRAAGLRKAIEEKRVGAPDLPVHLIRSLQQLDDKLDELKQWKDYAVAPKRSALIEEMESLIGASDEPQTLAGRIKSLQQEWRTISKGIVSEDSEDWKRFHQASQSAYQPCQIYFAAQAKIRQDNLQGRKALIERLTAFEASQAAENPDWRLMARALREAPLEWRRHFPVERESGRAVQEQFDALMSRLKTRLDGWYEHNVSDKRALILRARHLLTQDDGREAIETVKRLQAQWKETEPAPREQEQTLWAEFREVCDAIFQKRQQAHAEYTAGLEGNKAKALALCEEVELAGNSSGAELPATGAKISEWRSAFDAMPELPRADARGLQERFERALERYESQLRQQHERDLEAAVDNLFAAGRRLQRFGWAVASDATAADLEALKLDVESFIAGVRQWPKGGQSCVKDALLRAGSMRPDDLEANGRALRMLCIRAEILSEIASPPEDEALRREHQVNRLMQGMGQGIPPDDWDAMTLEWVRNCVVEPQAGAAFENRFVIARSKRPKRSAAPSPRRSRPDAAAARGPRRDFGRERSR